MPDNTNYSKEQNTTRSKIIADNINFKETSKPQIVVNEFPERQHTFPGEQFYSEAKNPKVYNSNNIIVSLILFKASHGI